MKKGRRKWAALSALVLLLVLSLGAVQTLPLEEEEKDSLTVFQGNRVLCNTGCQGYYMQQGKPVRARGIDRQEDRPALYCSYPRVCVNCQRHMWYHIRLECQPLGLMDAAIRQAQQG